MSTADIAQGMVDLNRQGKFAEAGDKYWSDDIVSIEPAGDDPVSRGKAAVHGKGEWWTNTFEVHNVEVEGPNVNGDQFTIRFKMDTTNKESGERSTMDEVGLYTVKDSKVVEERFFYGG